MFSFAIIDLRKRKKEVKTMATGKFVPELLKSEMVKNRINAESMSDKLGINLTTFYRKLNGESEFNRQEMGIMKSVLCLSNDDMDSIFFAS